MLSAAILSADEFTGGEGGLGGEAIDVLVEYETRRRCGAGGRRGAYFRSEGTAYFSAGAVAYLLNRGLVTNGFLGDIGFHPEGEVV